VRAVSGRSGDSFGGIFTGYSFYSTFTTPTGAVVTAIPRSPTSIDWSWQKANGADSYNVLNPGTLAPLPCSPVATPGVAGLTFTCNQSGLSTNALYGVVVQPVNGGGTGPLSPTTSAYTLAIPPTGMATTAVSTNSATFAWTAGAAPPLNPAYTFYEVNVATDPLFAVVVATETTQALTLKVSGLFPSSTYYARVRAYSGGQSTTTFSVAGAAVTDRNSGVSLSSSPPSVYAPPGGVVGLWQFDEGSGTNANDTSGYANAGRLTCLITSCVSTPTYTSGPANLGNTISRARSRSPRGPTRRRPRCPRVRRSSRKARKEAKRSRSTFSAANSASSCAPASP
jgi:hypothetical protein